MKLDFVVVGFGRCGTTSLFEYLNQHPEIFIPKIKEVCYFGKDLINRITKKDFESLYENKEDYIKGDVTPDYVISDLAHKEIYKHNKDIKVIIIKRDKKTAIESLKWMDPNKSDEFYYEYYNYKKHIKKYRDLFKNNLLVVDFEDLFKKNKKKTYKKILDFLNIKDTSFIPNLRRYNKRHKKILFEKELDLLIFNNVFLRKLSKKLFSFKTRSKFRSWKSKLKNYLKKY